MLTKQSLYNVTIRVHTYVDLDFVTLISYISVYLHNGFLTL